MKSSDALITEIADKLAIRELLERYCDGVNQKDPKILRDCWAEDGVWVLPLTTQQNGKVNEDLPKFAQEMIKRKQKENAGKANMIEGRDAIITIVARGLAQLPFDNMMAMPGFITVTGDNAKMRCYQEEAAVRPDGEEIRPRGQYDDELIKINDEWKFARRTLTILLKGGKPYPYGGKPAAPDRTS